MNDAIESLITIIDVQKKQVGTSYQDAVAHWNDYKTFWAVGEVVWKALATLPMQNRPFVPLAEINVGEAVYKMAVDKAYGKEVAVPQPQLSPASHFEKYIENLKSKHNTDVGLEDAEHTKEDVEKIWNSILNPPSLKNEEDAQDEGPARTTDPDEERQKRGKLYGLVVGRVQSGKTRNYTGLLIKAFDEGWNTVIVMTSDRTTLADQTFDRIEHECRDVGLAIRPILFGNRESIRTQWYPGEKYVAIAQKNVHHLRNMEQWLDKLSKEDLQKIKMLVLDDEADNATPDTQQSSSYVLTETDIGTIVKNFPSHDRGAEFVKEWIRGLANLDAVERTIEIGIAHDDASANEVIGGVKQKIAHATSQAAIIELLRDRNGYIAKILGADNEKMVESGQLRWLNELIIDKMNHNRRQRHPYDNSRILQSLIQYVFEVRVERSRINHLVATIFSDGGKGDGEDKYHFGRMAYVSYTATPYANLLNEDPKRDPLASDFMYPMHTSRHYIGMMRMFGAPQGRHDKDPNMRSVREIDESEMKIVEAIQSGLSYPKDPKVIVTDDLYVSWPEERDGEIKINSAEWKSLKESIAWLFCAAAARRFARLRKCPDSRKTADRWTTMMLNIGIDTTLHSSLKEMVEAYIRWICDHKENFHSSCHKVWENLKSDFKLDDFRRACADYGEVEDYPTWREIADNVRWFLQHMDRVHSEIANGTTKGEEGMCNYRDVTRKYKYDSDDHIWILCGGYTMSRGLTLDGLVVSYVDRMRQSTAVDTLIQIGRWFGYREGYELLPRVWLSGDAIEEFKKMAFAEDCLHRELKHNFDMGFSPKSGDHYAKVMKFSRRLSGRSAAEMMIGQVDGSFDVFNAFLADSRCAILSCIKKFVTEGLGLSGQLLRPAADYRAQGERNHRYHTYPYWKSVEHEKIECFLSEYADLAPSEEKIAIEALISEVSAVPQKWDVVFSDAMPRERGADERFELTEGMSLSISNTPCTSAVNSRYFEFGKFSGDNIAFFSGVKTSAIVHGEIDLCKKALSDKTNKKNKNVILPPGWDNKRVESLFGESESNGYRDELPSAIRYALLGSQTRMTSKEYRKTVFQYVEKPDRDYDSANPILQIALIRPPEDKGLADIDIPFAAVSFFWPNHNDSRYSYVAAGAVVGSMDDASSISVDEMRVKIDECLKEHGFLKRSTLREMIIGMFDPGLVDDEKLSIALTDGRTRYAMVNPNLSDSLESHIVKSTIYSKSRLAEEGGTEATVIQYLCRQIEHEAFCVLMQHEGFAECCGELWKWMKENDPHHHLECVYGELDDLFLAMYGKRLLTSFHIGNRAVDGREGWVVDKAKLWRLGMSSIEELRHYDKDLSDEIESAQKREEDDLGSNALVDDSIFDRAEDFENCSGITAEELDSDEEQTSMENDEPPSLFDQLDLFVKDDPK